MFKPRYSVTETNFDLTVSEARKNAIAFLKTGDKKQAVSLLHYIHENAHNLTNPLKRWGYQFLSNMLTQRLERKTSKAELSGTAVPHAVRGPDLPVPLPPKHAGL